MWGELGDLGQGCIVGGAGKEKMGFWEVLDGLRGLEWGTGAGSDVWCGGEECDGVWKMLWM